MHPPSKVTLSIKVCCLIKFPTDAIIFHMKKYKMIPGSKGQEIRCKLACKRIFDFAARKNMKKQPDRADFECF